MKTSTYLRKTARTDRTSLSANQATLDLLYQVVRVLAWLIHYAPGQVSLISELTSALVAACPDRFSDRIADALDRIHDEPESHGRRRAP